MLLGCLLKSSCLTLPQRITINFPKLTKGNPKKDLTGKTSEKFSILQETHFVRHAQCSTIALLSTDLIYYCIVITWTGLHILFMLNDPRHLTNFAFKILVKTFILQELCCGCATALIKAIYILFKHNQTCFRFGKLLNITTINFMWTFLQNYADTSGKCCQCYYRTFYTHTASADSLSFLPWNLSLL